MLKNFKRLRGADARASSIQTSPLRHRTLRGAGRGVLRQAFSVAAATAFLGLASHAAAAPVTFFGEDTNNGSIVASHPNSDAARASFFSTLTGVGTETFESFTPGATAPLTVNFAGAGTATISGTGDVVSGANAYGRFPISGSQFYETDGTFNLAFSAPVSAFGFYGTDLGDIGASLTLTLTGSNGVTTLAVPNLVGDAANGSALYFAFYDTANTYSSISFAGAGDDVFGFDDFSVGSRVQVTAPISAAPEPGAWVLMLGGVGMLGATLRLRRLRRRQDAVSDLAAA